MIKPSFSSLALAVASGLFCASAVAAAPAESSIAVFPRLTDVGGASLVGTGGAQPAYVDRGEEWEWVAVRDVHGNAAVIRPGDALAGEPTVEAVNAFLDDVDTHLDEIAVNVDAGLGPGEPLCPSCVHTGSDTFSVNAAVVELLDKLYILQLEPLELTLTPEHQVGYDPYDMDVYLGSLGDLLDWSAYSSMVEFGQSYSYQVNGAEGVYTVTVYELSAGDPHSGDVWITEYDGEGNKYEHKAMDMDWDDDEIPNSMDPDIDGDNIPNEEDPDVDGDNTPNDQDNDDDSAGCFPRTMGVFDRPPFVDASTYTQDVAYVLELEAHNFLLGQQARVLYSDLFRGVRSRAETIAALNQAYALQNANRHPVFSVYGFH